MSETEVRIIVNLQEDICALIISGTSLVNDIVKLQHGAEVLSKL